jgi:hypothetical protein
MNPQLLPAQLDADVPAWTQTVQAFLAEKERRSGSRRTVEGYARMLWPFLNSVGSPDRVTPAHVLAWAHGIGASGHRGSPAAVWTFDSIRAMYAIDDQRSGAKRFGSPCPPRRVAARRSRLDADRHRSTRREGAGLRLPAAR